MENLVHEEYAVNYQKEKVSGNGNAEKQSDQVRYNLVMSVALINEQYKTIWMVSSILLSFQSPHRCCRPLILMCICRVQSRMWWNLWDGGMTTAMYIPLFIIWHWIIWAFLVSLLLLLFVLQLRSPIATSMEVEHVFSQGQQLLHFTRSRLGPSSIYAYMCLGSWSRHDLLLMGDLLSVLRATKKRGQVETDDEN